MRNTGAQFAIAFLAFHVAVIVGSLGAVYLAFTH